jgi:hypothetical protein
MTPHTYASPEAFKQALEYDGLRFRAECKLAGKLYGQRFGVDVAFGDPILGEPEVVVAQDVLAFAGIAARVHHAARATELAREGSARPGALASAQALDAKRLRAALEQTFAFRKTHALPGAVPAPAEAWRTPYEVMAREDQLRWTTLGDVTTAAKAFLDPVLAGGLDATWLPTDWRWG